MEQTKKQEDLVLKLLGEVQEDKLPLPERNLVAQQVFMVFKLEEDKWYYLVERLSPSVAQQPNQATGYGPFKTEEAATNHLRRVSKSEEYFVLNLESCVITDNIQELIDNAHKNLVSLN